MALIFELIRGGSDNLAYVVGCSRERTVAVIDPVNAHSILEFCQDRKLTISYILNTHGHADHTSGNEVIRKAHEAKVLAHPRERIRNIHRPLRDGDVIGVGKQSLRVLHTPGHTAGSVCFLVNHKLLCGDTLFVAGAGTTRYGGNVEDLFRTFTEKLMRLPDRLQVFPGHDYAEVNLRFARTLEPDNPAIDRKLKERKDSSRRGQVLTSTIGEERRYNPFFRCQREELIASMQSEYPDLEAEAPAEVFRFLRELRNQW